MLYSRVIREGAESSFVESFLEKNDLFQDEKLEYLILQETITDGGIPDILVVSWDKMKKIEWTEERSKLTKPDLKILHFIYSKKKKGINIRRIVSSLGFSHKNVLSTIGRLVDSKIVIREEDRVTINLEENIFFIEDIVAIEAKLNNLKKAIEQAKLNLNFSSKSYVLVPEQKKSTLNKIDKELITGVITYDGEQAKVIKKAKNNKLPGSYYSWLINEHIGRFVNER